MWFGVIKIAREIINFNYLVDSFIEAILFAVCCYLKGCIQHILRLYASIFYNEIVVTKIIWVQSIVVLLDATAAKNK